MLISNMCKGSFFSKEALRPS